MATRRRTFGRTNKVFKSIPQTRFPRGTITILTDSRIPPDGLAQMYNMTLEQDSVPRPRPPFVPYGNAALGTIIGMGTFTKMVSGKPQYYEISMQVIATNEVQSLSISGTPTGGTFTLTFNGQTTAAIAYNAAASAVQSALRALSNIGSTGVVCSGGALPGTAVTITFQGTLANTNVAQITASSAGLTGGTSPTASISTTTQGGPTSYICTRKDGGNWTQLTGSYPITYDTSAWVTFTQGAQLTASDTSDDRVYITNGVNNMSYYDIEGNNIIAYVGLSTPGSPTLTASGSLSGTNYNQYYRVSANNAGGESAASASQHVGISTARDFWVSGQTITISWSAVSGATSYNIYTADQSGSEVYLATVSGLTFLDDGNVALNTFKPAPNNDSSAGPILDALINIDNQLYGVGDPTNPQYLWYSGQGTHFGDFSFNPQGGGYVGIDYGGSTVPRNVFPFHDGKGNPAPSVLTYGPAGRGKLVHIQFTSTTIGTTVLTYPSVYEASAQDGCPSSRGVAIYNNNAYYCTGTAFKTTGTKPNVVNILATDSIADQILPNIQDLDLNSLDNYVSLEYLGKIYFFLPVGGGGINNQVWVLDLTRGGLWILYWELATAGSIDHAWLYQDNSGASHFLILQNNEVLEHDLLRATTPTQDNGMAFSTLLKSGAMVFDEGGVAEVASYFSYFKFLYPQGTINTSISGVTEDGTTLPLGADELVISTAKDPFLWGVMMFSNPDGSSVFSGHASSPFSGMAPGSYTINATPSQTRAIEIDEILSEQKWQISTDQIGCDYLLSSVTTTIYTIPRRYAGQG